MSALRDQLQRRAGLAAFGVGALVFGALSVAKPGTAAAPAMVPVLKRFVAAGSPVSTRDIRWVSDTKMRPAPRQKLSGYARVPLFPGEILSPVQLGKQSRQAVLVAVAPTSGVDARVARVGGSVDVLVTGAKGVLWQSGPLAVVGRSLGAGTVPSVTLAMTYAQAVGYERVEPGATIEMLGVTP